MAKKWVIEVCEKVRGKKVVLIKGVKVVLLVELIKCFDDKVSLSNKLKCKKVKIDKVCKDKLWVKMIKICVKK